MSVQWKKGAKVKSSPDSEEQMAAARNVMTRRKGALRELAGTIMQEDREILRKPADRSTDYPWHSATRRNLGFG